MPRDTGPPKFKPWMPPLAPAVQQKQRAGRFRGSPRARGLNARWDKLSLTFRRRNPFCRWCRQQDKDTLVSVVDHIKPWVDYPHLRFEWTNLQSLCATCHGLKYRMEYFARKNGMLEMLPLWSEDPLSRPIQFRPGA